VSGQACWYRTSRRLVYQANSGIASASIRPRKAGSTVERSTMSTPIGQVRFRQRLGNPAHHIQADRLAPFKCKVEVGIEAGGALGARTKDECPCPERQVFAQ